MSALQLAPVGFEPLVMRVCRHSRAVLRGMWNGVEHICDGGTMPGLRPPVAVDLMSSMSSVVATQRLVRRERRAPLIPITADRFATPQRVGFTTHANSTSTRPALVRDATNPREARGILRTAPARVRGHFPEEQRMEQKKLPG